jgi:ribosome-binding protein aMBF1 (putative translation factor)
MGYQPLVDGWATLRDRRLLEKAMRDRDLSGRELAVCVQTSAQTISQLRRGVRRRVNPKLARDLERILRVTSGKLFAQSREDVAA